MIRINDHEVELTNDELAAVDFHGDRLDNGYGIVDATIAAHFVWGDQLSAEFYSYLSDGEWAPTYGDQS